MTRLAAFALIPCLAASPVAAAQSATPAVVTPAPVVATTEPLTANETRQDLQEILRELPPAVAAVLRHDPSLLTRTDYLAPYPRLAAFLQSHPQVALNPAYFIGTPDTEDAEPNGRAMRMAEEVVEGIGVFVIISSVIGFFVWVVRTIIDHRRWLRLSKVQVDVHSKVLDRLSSHDDLLAYIQSPSGRRFLDSAPIEMGGAARPSAAALTRVMWSLQAGIVLCAVGLGFWMLGRTSLAEAAQGLSIISTLALTLGLGFIVSAGASYTISTRHGLIGGDARAQHE
ncbi:MAG: hypothetical protein JNL48_00120 [Acidobacteria bacterium]|nr:hypothetical protein [Acidobacteriota bacterium]